MSEGRERVRPSGWYRRLKAFQVATVIFDATVVFCEKFVDKKSRTIDQMVQAARSGRQNIAEGSRAAATSSQTELRLVNAGRFSLEELLLDYEDFLRQRKLRQWAVDDPEALEVRNVGKEDRSDRTDHAKHYAAWLEHDDPAVRANALICLIHQTNFLLDQLISALEKAFVEGGGYSEQLATERIKHRAGGEDKIPKCPGCGGVMVLRTAKQGKNAGREFWGCSRYPKCKGTRALEAPESDGSD